MVSRFETNWAGRTISLETGKLAGQAHGAVLVRYGETVLLATVVRSDKPSDLDFFPLTVHYEERQYAAGKIPGGFPKREGRPSEGAILASRLTDRPLRPLFPKGYKHDVQIISTVMSTDYQNEPDLLSIIGSSAAVCISDIPFSGPVGAARVGYIDGQFVLNPTVEQREQSELELTVAGSRDAVLMVEGSAHELPEETMLGAVKFAHESMQPVIQLQEQLIAAAGKEKHPFEVHQPDEEFSTKVAEVLDTSLREAVNNPDKALREDAISAAKANLVNAMVTAEYADPEALGSKVAAEFEAQLKEEVRAAILTEGRRPDGRTPEEIRPVSAEVGLLPRAHGSAVFTRGQTQIVSVATLGTLSEEQMLDDLGTQTSKRFIHHYNFPPYSTGESKPLRAPSRRDIGHGALAERSVLPVMPSSEDFPYTVRVVSEVISSNGSSSMGSVCGTTLALMDAGVPIKAPVSGIAMGLITGKDGSHRVLSDIQGIEDALGDMDFKVAGTEKGVTGLQMDIKTTGLSFEIMQEAFEQAREGRAYILGIMLKAMPQVRGALSSHAPRIITTKISPDKIGALIGPGGKVIRGITESTGARIDIEDDGTVLVYSSDQAGADAAMRQIGALTKEIEVGQIYEGKVVRIMPYGAFVELVPGKDGLVHISELAESRVERVEDVVDMGDPITVMVTDIDRGGKVSLSRRAALTGQMSAPRQPRQQYSGGGGQRQDRDRGQQSGSRSHHRSDGRTEERRAAAGRGEMDERGLPRRHS